MFDLKRLLVILKQSSNLKCLPQSQFKEVAKGMKKTNKIKIYQAKSGKLRLYFFHLTEIGRIIILAGKKVDQKKDLELVVKKITSYLNYFHKTLKHNCK